MVGKAPHRHEGKKKAEEVQRRMSADLPHGREIGPRKPDPEPGPEPTSLFPQVGGARPGTPSRVLDAIEEREARREAKTGEETREES